MATAARVLRVDPVAPRPHFRSEEDEHQCWQQWPRKTNGLVALSALEPPAKKARRPFEGPE